MAKGDAVAAAIRARIQGSAEAITLVFPAKRSTLAPGPTALPASPMSGAAPMIVLDPTDPTPEWAPRTVKCLWLDAPLSEKPENLIRDRQVGWVDGAGACARVLWEDAAIDVLKPDLGTWLDRAETVRHRDLGWRVIKIEKMGPSFRAPHSLSVWLAGGNVEGARIQ